MRTRCIGFLIAIVFAVVVVVGTASTGFAQTSYYWQVEPPVEDDWFVDENWLEPDLQNQYTPDQQYDEVGVIDNGGTAYVDSDGGIPPGGVTLGSSSATSGTLEIRSGGVLEVMVGDGGVAGGGISVGPHSSGVGTLRVLPGGTLTAEGSLTSGYSGGDTIVVGGAASGTATLSAASAIIGGFAQVYPNAAFSTAGSFNYLASATYQVEVNSSGNGFINVGGNAGLDGSLNFNFTGVSPVAGSSYTVLEAAAINGSFDAVTYSASLPYNQTFVLAEGDAGGGRANLTATVEEVLVLNVNRDTGVVTMNHPGTSSIAIDSYYIGSDAGALVPANWTSFYGGGILGGDWLETDARADNLGEVKLSGDASIAASSQYNLGAIFDPYAGAFGEVGEDLEFVFSRESDGALLTGVVTYTGTSVNTLVLQVDPATGETYLCNPTETTVQFDSYHIASDSGALSTTGWDSLDDQDADGAAWLEFTAPALSANLIGEFNALGFTTLSPGTALNLGNLYTPASAEDLQFEFLLMGEEEGRVGQVFYEAYVPPEGVDGDYNDDGIVDAADYTVWRDNLGTSATLPNDPTPGTVDESDYAVWKSHYGQTAGSGSGALAAVPEPAAWLLALVAGLLTTGRCRKRVAAA